MMLMGCLSIVAANGLRFALLVCGIVGACRHKPTKPTCASFKTDAQFLRMRHVCPRSEWIDCTLVLGRF
jgi:hypothetical protein